MGAFTATAKKDVIQEILSHFKEKLSLDLESFIGGVQRENLNFQVWPVTKNEKYDVVFNCLQETVARKKGGAIVYCSTRRRTEELSLFLNEKGMVSESFHSKRSEPDKRNIQDAFIEGKLQVICATNAFGMGIDKKDIRLVIHADIPGSLENYLQEAGRAGRDMEPSDCILLYEKEDIESQFSLNAYSKLSIKDIKKILAILKKKGAKTPEIIITPGEIMRLIGYKDFGDNDGRARIGVSWLERKGFVERSFNQTLFFKGTPVVKNMEEAGVKIEKLNLSKTMRAVFTTILHFLFNAEPNTLLSADEICTALGKIEDLPEQYLDSRHVITLLSDMAERILKAIANDKGDSLGKSLKITGRRGMDQLKVYVKFSWQQIRERIELRHRASRIVLETIISCLPAGLRDGRAEVLAQFFLTDIMAAMGTDIFLSTFRGDKRVLIEQSLLYLHDVKVITLQNGLGVFRQAMTLALLPAGTKRQYTKGDYEPLSHHYDQKNVQVHVMEKFARLGLEKIKTALNFVSDYFSSSYDTFISQYFPDEKKIIKTAMTAEAYKKIIQSLENNIQEAIVGSEPEKNSLVLAGPGSGKTKTIVHRCAWLIKAKSVDPSSILVLCFNHQAMLELKKRIRAIAGQSADSVTAMTYHGFAMRLTGRLEQDSDTRISIMAVGDDDQSIYGFRNASVVFIKKFKQDYDARTYFLMENYRSSYPIIQASNAFIALNENRMKNDQPCCINRKRKSLEQRPDTIAKKALVQIVQAADIATQAVFVAKKIKQILKENPEARPDDVAVISRQGISYPFLVAARMALASENIKFCHSLKNSAGFPLFRVREIQAFIRYLDDCKTQSLRPDELKQEILGKFDRKNTWTHQIEQILESWCRINPDRAISIARAKDFALETLLEGRREHKTGNGVFLGTVHSVKGMQFLYVFILDGGWKSSDMEEERRLFYVGMTRAKEKLFLCHLENLIHPHIRSLKGNWFTHENTAAPAKIQGFSDDLTVSILGMADMYLDYPGLFPENHEIHRYLSDLETGDKVSFKEKEGRMYIVNDKDQIISSLSKKGATDWHHNIGKILNARVLAVIRRTRQDNEDKASKNVTMESWDLPVVEILHKNFEAL
ncbi:MAG: UvrD-helicase domain-containing protein [Proteobacteria bacterium]|nr:UvrD-helicase domain-containing protein [Pseudomonadota bacterium]MBU1584335.1 UvrD-helicase domain-containing protein [Pseudomonadota bacterium]MBU2455411.1 UvrD-helicase domain-containing protein [Pseudomonadota bacterium]MBU2631161.1 UvrD-helicase domain-containing protein [Pseudomonadota bacterium]